MRTLALRGLVLPGRPGAVAVIPLVLLSVLFLGPQAEAAQRFREFTVPTAAHQAWAGRSAST